MVEKSEKWPKFLKSFNLKDFIFDKYISKMYILSDIKRNCCGIYNLKKKCDLVIHSLTLLLVLTDKVIHRGAPLLKSHYEKWAQFQLP